MKTNPTTRASDLCPHSILSSDLGTQIAIVLQYLPDGTHQHFPSLAAIVVSGMAEYPISTSLRVFALFPNVGEHLKEVDHLIYPPLLLWVVANARETRPCADALGNIRKSIISGGSEKFQGIIIRSMLQIAGRNSALFTSTDSILIVVACELGQRFLLYMHVVQQWLDMAYHAELMQCLRCIENDADIPESLKALGVAPKAATRKLVKTHSQQMRRSTSGRQVTTLPSPDFDEGQWLVWQEEFSSQALLHSYSPGIAASGHLSERYPPFKAVVFPIALAGAMLEDPDMKLVRIVFSAKALPPSLTRLFLNVSEILEVLRFESPIPDTRIRDVAFHAKQYHQALRAAERLVASGLPEAQMLIKIYLALDLPLAAAGAFKYCEANKLVSSSSSIEYHELLGNWDTVLEHYTGLLRKEPGNRGLLHKRFEALRSLSQYVELATESLQNPKDQAIA
jgi:hypothetical protein